VLRLSPFLVTLLLLSTACAPLVSRRKRTDPPVAVVPQRKAVRQEPIVEAPPPPPPPAPAVIARPEPPPPPPPVVEEPPAPPPEVKASERNTFYAFNDREISKLEKRSKKFKKLRAQHKKCTSKSEKLIMQRDRLREEIIELQNLEDRTLEEDDRLAQLRKDEHRMKQDKASLATCEPIEKRLTEMLQAEYGTTASIDSAIY
jgi:hypothetical protein